MALNTLEFVALYPNAKAFGLYGNVCKNIIKRRYSKYIDLFNYKFEKTI